VARQFADRIVYSPAGDIALSAAAGDVRVNSGSTLDMSAAGVGTAGTLTVDAHQGMFALDGVVNAGASTAEKAGSVKIDVLGLSDFSALNAALNSGQFLDARQ